jgi:DNA helicase II / ATP-dependent DNA helicase PcrA
LFDIPAAVASLEPQGEAVTQQAGEAGEEITKISETPVASAILAGLNVQQQEAVQSVEMPLLIVAGPGTGKTRTLTHRIAYLLTERGVAPENTLAITFTNKAAQEMTQRLGQLLGRELAGRLVIKTFHAFGAMLLRAEALQLGLSPTFSICSEQERQTLLKGVYPKLGEKEINSYLEQISTAKNSLLSPESPALQAQPPETPEFIDVYRGYEAALQKNQLLDFDDLILRLVELFEATPDILEKYRQRFRWISVDEYQDINVAQYRLLRLLAAPGVNLAAIGDPNQAIYGFRGANREYFLKFAEDFPGTKTISLEQNYRSTQLILEASGQVITGSAEGEPFKLWSEFIEETKLDIYQSLTDKAEAEYTNSTIKLLTFRAFLLTYPNCSKQSANQSPTRRLFCLESYHSMGDRLFSSNSE